MGDSSRYDWPQSLETDLTKVLCTRVNVRDSGVAREHVSIDRKKTSVVLAFTPPKVQPQAPVSSFLELEKYSIHAINYRASSAN